LLFGAPSLSALTLEQLQQQLTIQKVIRGDFSQVKTLQIFNQPLLSNGSFLLSHEQGLVWTQKDPFSVSIVLAKNKLRQQFEGQQAEVIEASDNPMVFYFSHLFLSLFKGEIASLQDQFSMVLVGDIKNTWVLILTPKASPLNKVFKKIEIRGQEQIEALLLIELNDDTSLIEFSNINQQQTPLTSQEQNAFEF
jgi:hypothetical protein